MQWARELRYAIPQRETNERHRELPPRTAAAATRRWRSNDERRTDRCDIWNLRNRGAGRPLPVLVSRRKRHGGRRRIDHVRRVGLRDRSPGERDTRMAPALLPSCGCSVAAHTGADHAKRRETSPARRKLGGRLASTLRTPWRASRAWQSRSSDPAPAGESWERPVNRFGGMRVSSDGAARGRERVAATSAPAAPGEWAMDG